MFTALSWSCISNAYVASIEVKRGASVSERLETARRFCTADRLARIREEVKHKLPGVTDTQLSGLTLRWNENLSENIVTIIVGMDTRSVNDATRIVDSAAQIIDNEVNDSIAMPQR
jgi:hypothetical protein